MFPVTLNGFTFEDAYLTCNLASGITAADVGKAVTLDPTAPNTVKLAGDGDPIDGRLETVELRTQEGQNVGTVAFQFAQKLPKASATVIAVGDSLVGAGGGLVKARPALTLTDSNGDTVTVPLPPARTRAVQISAEFVIALHV